MLLSACGGSSSTSDEVATDQPAAATDQASTADTGSDDVSAADAVEGQPSEGTDAPGPEPSAAAETRDEILRLAGTQLDGIDFDPDTVAGRDVLLWFWAPW